MALHAASLGSEVISWRRVPYHRAFGHGPHAVPSKIRHAKGPLAVAGGTRKMHTLGEGFPAKLRIDGDMGDFQALEFVHAAGPFADEADPGRVLTPRVSWGVEMCFV
jgi:hypothetical protein